MSLLCFWRGVGSAGLGFAGGPSPRLVLQGRPPTFSALAVTGRGGFFCLAGAHRTAASCATPLPVPLRFASPFPVRLAQRWLIWSTSEERPGCSPPIGKEV